MDSLVKICPSRKTLWSSSTPAFRNGQRGAGIQRGRAGSDRRPRHPSAPRPWLARHHGKVLLPVMYDIPAATTSPKWWSPRRRSGQRVADDRPRSPRAPNVATRAPEPRLHTGTLTVRTPFRRLLRGANATGDVTNPQFYFVLASSPRLTSPFADKRGVGYIRDRHTTTKNAIIGTGSDIKR